MAEVLLRKVDMDWLLCFYGAMLTEKQRIIASLYYEEDYSLAEIAQLENISRQGVHETLQRVEKQLRLWEDRLGLRRRFTAAEQCLQEALNCPETPDAAKNKIQEALHLLMDEEIINGL